MLSSLLGRDMKVTIPQPAVRVNGIIVGSYRRAIVTKVKRYSNSNKIVLFLFSSFCAKRSGKTYNVRVQFREMARKKHSEASKSTCVDGISRYEALLCSTVESIR